MVNGNISVSFFKGLSAPGCRKQACSDSGSHYSPLQVVCVEADQDIRAMAKCKPDWGFD